MKFYLLFLFTTLTTIVMGCGGGGGAVTLNEATETFVIPPTGAVMSGDGIFSNTPPEGPFEFVQQNIVLSGGDSGTFTGSSNGVNLSGTYIFDHVSGSSVGTMRLLFNDSGLLLSEGEMSLPITFTGVDPVVGIYSNGSSAALTNLFVVSTEGTTAVSGDILSASDLAGQIRFLD